MNKLLAGIVVALALIGGWASVDAQIIRDEEEPYIAAEWNYWQNNDWIGKWWISEDEGEIESAIQSLIAFLIGEERDVLYGDCTGADHELLDGSYGFFLYWEGREADRPDGFEDRICLTRINGKISAAGLFHEIAHVVQRELPWLEGDWTHGYRFGTALDYVYQVLFSERLDHYCGYNGHGCEWRVERRRFFDWSPWK